MFGGQEILRPKWLDAWHILYKRCAVGYGRHQQTRGRADRLLGRQGRRSLTGGTGQSLGVKDREQRLQVHVFVYSLMVGERTRVMSRFAELLASPGWPLRLCRLCACQASMRRKKDRQTLWHVLPEEHDDRSLGGALVDQR